MRDTAAAADITENDGIDSAEIGAIERWAGDLLVPPGDDPATVLIPGSAYRRALDEARAEMASGRPSPSAEWRRRYALLLGLQRLLAEDTPKLASGLDLRPHQVDALAGMLGALLADAERGEPAEENGDDEEPTPPGAVAEAVDEDEDDDEDDEDDEDEREELDADADDEAEDDEEDGAEAPPPPDPGAARRYRFKHPTASGKTVAAAGFVDAARVTGVLILTHRRLLVDQFERDLKEQGYARRLHAPVLRGHRAPQIPPVTIETYAWFIRNADTLNRDVYGVVLCDEAHTALGDRTSAAIRRLDTPTYIGMTATDQLLQKHVSDVFPVEIDDFPLADAVREGVVAPLRAIRVKPGASVKRVRIVGGDYDQRELAGALDHDAVNMAAAMFYSHMFGNRPGIVYAAGVDHAHRVANAMVAVGLKAAAVSGRTPPRELANRLAAYERGEINVLVNAQILAEGWNAPRATVCIHLAPTASRRVYQQRLGRIMRLHRRKEAGVVVDFVEDLAPHTERTVTVHSLLGVDLYQPGALVTPRSPKARRRWRRAAKPLVTEKPWVVPVTPDPQVRRRIIEQDWKTIAIERLPPDEQEYWAEHAALRVQQKDLSKLAKVLAAVTEDTRMRFFATCAAQNKSRQLRLIALGDLAQHCSSARVFNEAVKMVEGMPTWRLDRAQGARTLLLALGDGRVPASEHQVVDWIWRLARASREAQFRRVASGLENGRDLARSLAGKSGDAARQATLKIVTAALSAPLDIGGALLAIVYTGDPGANRLLDQASARIVSDPRALAAALAANVPLPRGLRGVRPTPKRRQQQQQQQPQATPTVAEPRVAESAEPATDAADTPSRRRRRRRRRRRASEAAEAAVLTNGQAGNGAAPPVEVEAPAPVVETEPAPAPERASAVEPETPKRRRPASEAAEPATIAAPPAETAPAAEPEKPKRRRRTTKAAEDAPATPAEAPVAPEPDPAPPRRRRTTKAAAAAEAPAPAAEAPAVAESAPAPPRRRRSAKAQLELDVQPAEQPAPRRRTRRAVADSDAGPTAA